MGNSGVLQFLEFHIEYFRYEICCNQNWWEAIQSC